jgi:hypothetical protein
LINTELEREKITNGKGIGNPIEAEPKKQMKIEMIKAQK